MSVFGEHSPFALRDFRFYLAGRFLSSVAQQIQTLGVGLYVYLMTRDPLALGLAGLFTFAPQLIFVGISGHVADTWDRRLISAAAFATAAFSALFLLVLVTLGVTNVGWYYLAIAFVGVSRAFGMPANSAMVGSIVPRDLRSGAVAWSASTMQTATIIGPAIGGFLYLFGAQVVFAVATFAHVMAALTILFVSPQRTAIESREPLSRDSFLRGARFIFGNKVLLGAMSLDLVGVLFAGVVALLPIFATDILNAGPQGLGLLRTSQAVGALSMALFLANFPIRRRAGMWMFVAVACFGLSIIGFGLSRTLWLSMLFMVCEGASDMVSVVIRQTLIQNETPDSMRGRVGSVSSLFIGASNSLGEFESGLAARLFGPVNATIIGGGICLGATALWARLFPDLRRRDRL